MPQVRVCCVSVELNTSTWKGDVLSRPVNGNVSHRDGGERPMVEDHLPCGFNTDFSATEHRRAHDRFVSIGVE